MKKIIVAAALLISAFGVSVANAASYWDSIGYAAGSLYKEYFLTTTALTTVDVTVTASGPYSSGSITVERNGGTIAFCYADPQNFVGSYDTTGGSGNYKVIHQGAVWGSGYANWTSHITW